MAAIRLRLRSSLKIQHTEQNGTLQGYSGNQGFCEETWHHFKIIGLLPGSTCCAANPNKLMAH